MLLSTLLGLLVLVIGSPFGALGALSAGASHPLVLIAEGADAIELGDDWSHPLVLGSELGADPIADLARFVRRLGKTMQGAASRWGDDWLPRVAVFILLALVMPIFDWSVFGTFTTAGARPALRSAALAILVYVRLLADSRAPLVGKALVVFGVVYGVALQDLMPDAFAVAGQLDDFVVLLVGAKAFATMCPKGLVEQHARIAARKLAGPGRTA